MKQYTASTKSGHQYDLQAENLKQARAYADRLARTDGDPIESVKYVKKKRDTPESLRFPADLKAKIQAEADKQNRTFSNMVQHMCITYLG